LNQKQSEKESKMGLWNLLFGPVDVNSIYEDLKKEESKKKDKKVYASADSGYFPIMWSDPGCYVPPSDGGGFSGGDGGCSGGGDGGGSCGH
jgi:hypothetical protein